MKRRTVLNKQSETNNGGQDKLAAFAASIATTEYKQPPLSGNWHTAVMGCGSNSFGQLSNDLDTISITPRLLGFNSMKAKLHVDSVSCYGNTTVTVENGSVFAWGEGMTAAYKVPTLLSSKMKVVQISCGLNHCGMIASDGKAYTWGKNESYQLGQGANKQPVPTPKPIKLSDDLRGLQISCGAAHTALIAAKASQILSVSVPVLDDQIETDLRCGQLYTFGLNRGGQLGLEKRGQSNDIFSKQKASRIQTTVSLPALVKQFEEDGLAIAQVSCGFHHTCVVAIDRNSFSFSSKVFTFGFGDDGRLGLGDDESCGFPQEVQFPSVFSSSGRFLPIEVAAGDQHSLVRGLGETGCYAFGSNTMGQLGAASNTQTLESSLAPVAIQIPPGYTVRKIAAGGRHSAAITWCGKLLTWGWSEEGQLGHGSERNVSLPKPCKLPDSLGPSIEVFDVSLGMSHTVLVLRNPLYEEEQEEESLPPPPPPEPEPESTRPPEPEPLDELLPEDDPEPEESSTKGRTGLLIGEEDEQSGSLSARGIRGIKELLQYCEEEHSRPPTQPMPSQELTNDTPVEQETQEEIEDNCRQEEEEEDGAMFLTEGVIEDEAVLEPIDLPLEGSDTGQSSRSSNSNGKKFQVFYKEGQDMTHCLVANSAKRAEIRRQKKMGSGQGSGSTPK